MARQRTDLHEKFVEILGSHNVYFQPPESLKLKYPCIVYRLTGIPTRHADNVKFFGHKQYTATIIDHDPDSEIVDRMMELKFSHFDRFYPADNLNHFVFTIYF